MQRFFSSSALCAFAAAVALAAPAAAETVTVQLRGFEEVPVNVSPATGSLRLFINDRAGTIDYELTYENLIGNVSQAHIHIGQAGVAAAIVIWLCQGTSVAPPSVAALTPACPTPGGTVSGTVTAANVLPTPGPPNQLVTAGDLDDVIRAIRAGVAYGNVHSSSVPGGEIRGQLH